MINAIAYLVTVQTVISYITKSQRKKRILFLCTGNYYRSRVVEEIFNHLAETRQLSYGAFSRGLGPNIEESGNVGPIAPYAISCLKYLQIEAKNTATWPKKVTRKDIESSEMVIALNRPEHSPLVRKYFPQYAKRVIYWNIPDVYEQPPIISVKTMYGNVENLLSNLNKV